MRKILLVPVLLWSLLMPLCADTPVITLSEAIDSAMENSTDMEIARLELQSSLRSASNASQYIPDLSLTGSATIMGSTLGNTTLDKMSGNGSAGFDIGITMGLGTSMIGSTAVNNAMKTVANLTYAMSLSDLEQSVTTSYWTLVSSKISLESMETSLAAAERTYASTKEAYDAGLATSLELSNAELSVLDYQYALKQLQDAYVLAQDAFRTLTGIEGEFDVTDFPEIVYLSLPSPEELYNQYGESSNTIKMLHASVASSEAALTLEQISSLYPSVSLALNYNLGGDAYMNYPPSVQNNINDSASATVTVSIPISSYIPGSSKNNSLKNAEDSVAISKLELNAGRKDYISVLRSTLTSIEQNRTNIEITSKKAEVAQNTYDLTLESYNAGLTSLSDLQTMMDALSSAQMELINAESEYIQNVYSLSFMLGIDYESLVTLYAEK